MARLLDRIDEWATARGLDGEVAPPHRFAPTEVEASPPLSLDLAQRRDQDASSGRPASGPTIPGWRCPVLDRKGRIRHDGGVVASPGLYLMGMPFLRRRKSSLIDGAGADARDLSDHLVAYLDGKAAMTLVAAE